MDIKHFAIQKGLGIFLYDNNVGYKRNKMKAKLYILNTRTESVEILEYQTTQGRGWVETINTHGEISRCGNPSRWLDSTGQEPIIQITNLLNGDIGDMWTHANFTFELVHRE